MSPDDVGGEEMLISIKRDIEEIVDDSLKFNMICYCRQLLSERNSESVQSEYHCRLCQKSLEYKWFDCDNKSCSLSKWFFICPSCHNRGEHFNLDCTQDEWKQIFVSKLRWNISAISYFSVFCILSPSSEILLDSADSTKCDKN